MERCARGTALYAVRSRRVKNETSSRNNKGDQEARLQRVKDMQAILNHVFNESEKIAASDDDEEVEIDELGNKVT